MMLIVVNRWLKGINLFQLKEFWSIGFPIRRYCFTGIVEGFKKT
jgi:hypothetical protein